VYRRGHYGATLLIFAPVGFVLVDAGHAAMAVAGGAAMLWLAMAPDWDHRIPFVPHRGPTHSLVFALLVGAGGAAVGAGLGRAGSAASTPTLVAFGFGVGAVAVLAHLAADALTPAGVPLFWPLSGRTYSLSLARADNTLANLGLFALGICATAAAALGAVRL
jgi:inner membrane protein